MRERYLARCLLLAFVLVTQLSVGFIQCHRCNHHKYQPVKRSTRSAPAAAAAVVATAAAAVSAAGNAPDWTSEENELESEETTQARLEYIKQQILRRLGLTNAPRIKKHIDISNYLKLFEMPQPPQPAPDESTDGPVSDESYQANKILILPASSTSVSVTFNLTSSKLATHRLTRMSLFVSEKASHATDTTSKEVSLYSSSHWKDPSNRSKQLLDKYLATILPLPAALEESSNELRSPTSGLLRYDLTGILKRELVERTTSFLTVNSNHFKMASASITIEFEETQVRKKRNPVDCVPGSNITTCCREHFYVNFTSIGWDDWILQPPGYPANYCKGQCHLSSARYSHSQVLQMHPWKMDLCCSPREMSALSVIYIVEDIIIQKNIPNMTVETCDCA